MATTRSMLEEQKQQVALYLGCDVGKLSHISRYELDVFLKHIEDDKKNGTIQGLSPEVYHRMIRDKSVPLEERLKVIDLKTCKVVSRYLKHGIKAMDVPKVKVSLRTMLAPEATSDSSCW